MCVEDECVKIDKTGRVVIPKEIREDMGIDGEALLKIEYSSSDKMINLTKAFSACRDCGSPNGIIPFGGKDKICQECLKKMIDDITVNDKKTPCCSKQDEDNE